MINRKKSDTIENIAKCRGNATGTREELAFDDYILSRRRLVSSSRGSDALRR